MSFNSISYEEAIEELEKIIDKLEEGDLTLEETLKNFKKGVKLYKYCHNILNRIEGEIKIITKDKEANILEEDFQLEVRQNDSEGRNK